ncbi:MAG: dUTP diphosphatase [Candidatus Kapabacteria bacterium]|nr:dUTP diphosphatase [Candidatus Kapabacteria bacterium]
MIDLKVGIKRLSEEFNDLQLPVYATVGSSGMDILAAIQEPIVLKSREVKLIPTNLAIALPIGYECQVRSRSGLAAKNGIFALNSPGTVDSDYRGEIKVILANFGDEEFTINRGDRIAQLVIAKHERAVWEISDTLDETHRSSGGFGSTGIAGNLHE